MTGAKISPSQALELLGHIAALDWRELSRDDEMAFAGAGEGARIAEVSQSQTDTIACLIGYTGSPLSGLMAVIGGDALQIEFVGCDIEGEPIAYSIPLSIERN